MTLMSKSLKIPTSFLQKCMQRLNLLWRLNRFRVTQSVLEIVYKTQLRSVLTFLLTAWFGRESRHMSKLVTIVRMARKREWEIPDDTEIWSKAVKSSAS